MNSGYSLEQLSTLRSAFEAGTFNKAEYSRAIWKIHERLFEYPLFLTDTNVDAIEISAEGVVFQLRDPQIKLWCTPQDERHVAVASLNFGDYESRELSAVLRLAKVCQTFYDVGANVGFYSIAVAKKFPDSKIVAFEPIPSTFEELKRNLALNNVKNVAVHNIGLSNRSSVVPFYLDPTVSGAASGAPLGSEFASTMKIDCPVETMDNFVERTELVPNFIKCDVEGGELGVFLGASKSLERFRPVVFTEMLRKWSARFSYHPNEIIALFQSLGYECFVLSEGMLEPFKKMTEETVETNFFFLHSQRHLEMVRFIGLLK